MRYFKKITALLFSVIIVLSVSSCAGSDSPAPSPSAPAEISDREGKTLVLPDKIEKIISMSPSVTETLINLGLADKIIAIDTYSASVEGVPEGLPQFDMMAPDTESIAVLKPDIIFATGMSRADSEDPFKPITDLGILMTYIPMSTSIQIIKDDIRFIGEVVGETEKAEALITKTESDINAITSKIPESDKGASVYFEVSAAPYLYSLGSGTFLNEMIELLGAKNIFADQNDWISVSEESVMEKNPDFIFTSVNYIDDPVGEILSRNGWEALNAVKNENVFYIDSDSSSRPNENIILALTQMAEALYPDLFK